MMWRTRSSSMRAMVAVVLACGTMCGVSIAQEAATALPTAQPATAAPAENGLYKSQPGRWGVKIIDEQWKDQKRNRTVPVRIYLPQDKDEQGGDEKRAVVIFSHGLGGSGANYAYFGKHLASHGYIVIAPTHPGSDTEQAKEWIKTHGGLFTNSAEKTKERREGEPAEKGPEPGAGMMPGMTREGGWMMATVSDPENLRNRPKDISFVIDQIATHAIIGSITDMQRIGVAGHSFGAYTAMAVGGMTVDLPEEQGGKRQSFRDERVKAVLPMSPEGAGTMGISSGAWEKFAVPVLFLTGTKDYGSGARSAAWRREGFVAATGVDHYLVTIENAGHMTFANPGEKSAQQAAAGLGMGLLLLGQNDTKKQKGHIELVESLSMAFFDAYVRGEAEAIKRLRALCISKRGDCVGEFAPGAKRAE